MTDKQLTEILKRASGEMRALLAEVAEFDAEFEKDAPAAEQGAKPIGECF